MGKKVSDALSKAIAVSEAKKKILDRIKPQVDFMEKEGIELTDEVDWGHQNGILISAKEAKHLIYIIQNRL